jgi:hypothetical protein
MTVEVEVLMIIENKILVLGGTKFHDVFSGDRGRE